ncbi:MAG: single-stranded DNA-binding protein [Clostridia bacterium]|nr:MAG: single-stranded DNA-binding protein [Clostridia bacterium]
MRNRYLRLAVSLAAALAVSFFLVASTGEKPTVCRPVVVVTKVERLLQPDDQADRAVGFIKVVTFGKVGEACSEHLYKGRRVAVEGSLRTARWQGEDGRVRQRVEVVARSVEFLDGKRKGDQNDAEGDEAAG